mmetsp:Transcript_540/g.930  ORF Transcript_540/g.930 Transcript_540/m.930 type:complete len:89 (+) Transcript_540:999-1265(+)
MMGCFTPTFSVKNVLKTCRDMVFLCLVLTSLTMPPLCLRRFVLSKTDYSGVFQFWCLCDPLEFSLSRKLRLAKPGFHLNWFTAATSHK